MGSAEAYTRDLMTQTEAKYPHLKTYLTGEIMMAHAGKRNGQSMVIGGLLAIGLISIIIALALRNIKLGLLSLIPNLAPGVIGFGLWGMFNGYLGIAAAPAVAVAFGVVVDNTIHFFSKYLRAKNEKNLSARGLSTTHSSVLVLHSG